MSRIGVLAALLLLPVSLVACGGNGLPTTAELTPDKTADAGGGSAYPTTEDTAATGPERFNPFADPPTGRRAGAR
ncbi:MAG: hypothetical protein M5U16_12755 [Hyphomicrobium sp.]|nr:hypothetical protein [Hyphomicrobium sp.]